jgi:hypothetical protein
MNHVENGTFNTLSFYHVVDNSSTPGGFLIGYSVIVVCLARPEAVSWAKLSHEDSFMAALAWPEVLKSQSQAR